MTLTAAEKQALITRAVVWAKAASTGFDVGQSGIDMMPKTFVNHVL